MVREQSLSPRAASLVRALDRPTGTVVHPPAVAGTVVLHSLAIAGTVVLHPLAVAGTVLGVVREQ